MKEHLTYKELTSLSFEDIEKLRNRRFNATVKFLLPHVTVYSKLFKEYDVDFNNIKTIDDWNSFGLPLIKKKYFINNSKDFLVNAEKNEIFQIHREFIKKISFFENVKFLLKAIVKFGKIEEELKDYYFPKMPFFSGGTEYGIPSQVFITKKQKENLQNIINVLFNLLKEKFPKPPLIGMNLFPYAPHLGWHATNMALDICSDINLGTAAGGTISTEKLVNIAKRAQPNIYAGMSEYFRNRFLEVMKKERVKLSKGILFINGATKLYEGEREKIIKKAKSLGAKTARIIDLYAASELKEALFPECFEFSGFHNLAPLSNIVKVVEVFKSNDNFVTDWSFKADEVGGYSTVWNIDGAGTLLEGYVIGDIFEKIEKTRCKFCGLNVERIFNIHRIKQVEAHLKITGIIEEKIKGTRIDLSAIRNVLLKIPEIEECQVILKRKPKTELIINIVSEKMSVIKKAKDKLKFLEITPKLNKVNLDSMSQKGLKFEDIIIES